MSLGVCGGKGHMCLCVGVGVWLCVDIYIFSIPLTYL